MNERVKELAELAIYGGILSRSDGRELARAIVDQQAEIDALRRYLTHRPDPPVGPPPPPHPSALKGVRQLTEELGVCRDPDVPFRHYGIRAARAEIKIRCEALKTTAEGRFDLGWNAFADRIIEEIEKAEREP